MIIQFSYRGAEVETTDLELAVAVLRELLYFGNEEE